MTKLRHLWHSYKAGYVGFEFAAHRFCNVNSIIANGFVPRNKFAFSRWLAKGGNTKYTPEQRQKIEARRKAWTRFMWIRKDIQLLALELVELSPKPSVEVERIAFWKPERKTPEIVNPFRTIPNVYSFTLGPKQGYDEMLLKFRLKKVVRLTPEIEVYNNGAMNRYAAHQIRRLNKFRDNPRLFWTIAWYCISRSKTFLILGINHVFPQWQRKLVFSDVMKILREFKDILREDRRQIEYKRVYIDKPSGGKRPLGVPTPAWRLYLHLLNQMMVIYIGPRQNPSQHGFWPKRGTLTAWREVLGKVLHEKNIVEFDFKKFFDSVNLTKLREILKEKYQLPGVILDRLNEMQRSVPNILPGDLPGDQDGHLLVTFDGRIVKHHEERKSKPYSELAPPDIPQDLMIEMMYEDMEDLDGVPREYLLQNFDIYYRKYLELQWAYLGSMVKTDNPVPPMTKEEAAGLWPKEKGVPQGAPTSPLLSTLVLNETIFSSFSTIMYADDGLIYGPEATKEQLMSVGKEWTDYGLELHPDKTHQVKKDGLWLRPLKFLGMEYDGTTDKLYARTRNGATLEFDKHDLIKALKSKTVETEDLAQYGVPSEEVTRATAPWSLERGVTPNSWVDLARSHIFGFLQSRMYSDRWSLDDVLQKDAYTYKPNSWSDLRPKEFAGADLRNSSSLASYWLAHQLRDWKWGRNSLEMTTVKLRPRINRYHTG